MKYRVFFEPMDIECPDRHNIDLFARDKINKNGYIISKVLPIDEDGFIIEQPKAHAPL